MNADLEAYLRGPAPVADDHYTNLQRQALAEVIQLSAEVVGPLESRIESDYEAARHKAQDRFDAERGRIELHRNTRGKEIQDHYDDRVEEIRANYEKQLSDVKVDIQYRRKKVNQTAVELEQRAEKEHQDQVLVAEFVAEGAVAKSTQRRQETESTVAGARHYLDGLEQQAGQLVRRDGAGSRNVTSTAELKPVKQFTISKEDQ